jgi:porphobilinogen synthase
MVRLRRLRVNEGIRNLIRETNIEKSDLIYPLFIIEGENIKNSIDSMPGIYQYSLDRLDEELEKVINSGIRAILIFGIPSHKDEIGSHAYDDNGITQRTVRFMKEKYSELTIIADVCLCEYTSHGHCGIINQGKILNDETLPYLSKMAVSLAKAGADIIAPSDMMDGRIKFIREALDDVGYGDVMIMSYSAKFASGYYAPFRDAAHSAPSFGDRKTYQMDPANRKEAIRECEEDIKEGADIIMVKPALAYLDIIRDVANETKLPIAAYNVSGEYAMVKAAASNGWIDERKIVMENLIGMKRAGAKIIITYHALDVARWIDERLGGRIG